MEMEMNIDAGIALGETLGITVDRLTAAAGLLEQTVERLTEKLAAAEQKLAALEAGAGAPSKLRVGGSEPTGRKTFPTAMTTLLAKQGVSLDALASDSLEAGAVDAALSSLSLEQRIAVKSQLLRAGLLS